MICLVGCLLQIAVSFWNVENYFDPFKDTLAADAEFTPYGTNHWTWGKFTAKRNALAKSIIAMDAPEIVGLAEVENRFVLWQLVNQTPLLAYDYKLIHRDSPDPRGIDVALLYRRDRFKPLHTSFYALFTEDSTRLATREILYVKGVCTVSADTLHLLVNHWPSQRGGKDSAKKRQVARETAVRITDSILLADTAALVVVTGDFNQPVAAWPGVVNVSAGDTYKYRGRWECLDQFLVSRALQRRLVRVEVGKYPFLLEQDDSYLGHKPKRTYSGPRYLGGISDHLPIRLFFTTFVCYGHARN